MTDRNTDNPRVNFGLKFGEEVVNVSVEFKFDDNAEEFFDVMNFVGMASHAILAAIRGSVSDE